MHVKERDERKTCPSVTPFEYPALLVSSGAVHTWHPCPDGQERHPCRSPKGLFPLITAMLGVTHGSWGGHPKPPATQPSTGTDTGLGPKGRHREVAPAARDRDIPSLEPLERLGTEGTRRVSRGVSFSFAYFF